MIFTFHNVSINSHGNERPDSTRIIFTFHNVSINSYRMSVDRAELIHLHSIMYLLIPVEIVEARLFNSIYIP